MKPGPLVLIVEDEAPVRRFLRTTLTAAGYAYLESETAADARTQASSHNPDLILLDLGLPDGDGLTLIESLRKAKLVMPIVVLSARNREDDKVQALDGGADDYLTKPFSAAELLARIRVALRHRDERGGGAALKRFVIGDELAIDFEKREVTVRGAIVHLSPTELKLLGVLARHAGKVLTHAQLLKDVWGVGHEHQVDSLRVYMTQLRRKLERNPAQPKLLLTELGVGYRLREGE